jgi:hypothetical protein
MTENHPITPPPDKIHNWLQSEKIGCTIEQIITAAAQWGADQELEACCEWINSFQNKFVHAHDLRLVRRSKPPSLKLLARKMISLSLLKLKFSSHYH